MSLVNVSASFVGFEKLKVVCSIGIFPHERVLSQEILISLKVSFRPAVLFSDAISSTIDYSLLAELCEQMALSRHRCLLETLACEIVEAVIQRFSCSYVWIRIEKPSAIAAANYAFVEYEKTV
jgi:dihydroneopterin aldolase